VKTREITADDVESLATGAGVLGTGGGTHPYVELLNVRKLYRQGKAARLVDPHDLADDAHIAVVGFMGAPLVTKERLTDPAHALVPVTMMEDYSGRPFDAVMTIEIGSENAMQPLMVGAVMDIPVIDADTMGRAFPEAQMSSFAIRGLALAPYAMADIRDNRLIISEAADQLWTERIGRKACTEMGSIAATCSAPRSGREVKDHALLGSVTRAIRLGRAVREAQRTHESPIRAVLEAERGVHLFTGKVADIARRTTEGFVRGEATIGGLGEFTGSTFSVDFQNEFTIGRRDGEICVTVPDLICILDSLTGEALGTETIRYGQRVDVLSLPAADIMTSAEGLAWVGPRGFGYDLDFITLHGKNET
jgi:uncharacterized protein